MANTTDVVSAIRELTNTKQLERGELLDLLKDGLHAALVKRYGPNVRAEIGIDELKGTIRIVVLRTVVETVEDPGSQVSLEEARFEDPEPHPVARGPAVREGVVQARGAGDPAGGRRDPGHRARGGEPHQDRRRLAGRRHRSGGRVRRLEGLARAGGRERARWRADRYRALVPGPRALRQTRARPRARGARVLGSRLEDRPCHRG